MSQWNAFRENLEYIGDKTEQAINVLKVND